MSEERFTPSMTYDPDVDAAYVYFRKADWDHMAIIDDYRNIDYGPDGEPNGVELLYVSDGVNLDGLPRRDLIERLLLEHHIPVFARGTDDTPLRQTERRVSLSNSVLRWRVFGVVH